MEVNLEIIFFWLFCVGCSDNLLVNDWLASGLGQGSSVPITPADKPPVGQEEAGSGRLFTFKEPTELNQVVERVKKLIGLSHCKF